MEVARQEEENRRIREEEICQVTDVTEEDFETTEGESVDLYDKLIEMEGWKVTDIEKEDDLTVIFFDQVFSTWSLFCLLKFRTMRH